MTPVTAYFGVVFIGLAFGWALYYFRSRRDARLMEEEMRRLFSGNKEAEDALEIAFNNDVLPILPIDIPHKNH